MRGGRLRHQMDLQQFTQTNPGGVDTATWASQIVFWGSIEPLRGNKYITAQQVHAQATHIVRTRAIIGFDFTPAKRISYTAPGSASARIFTIVFVANVDERDIQLEIMCKEETDV